MLGYLCLLAGATLYLFGMHYIISLRKVCECTYCAARKDQS